MPYEMFFHVLLIRHKMPSITIPMARDTWDAIPSTSGRPE
jgi:hypothetical protein